MADSYPSRPRAVVIVAMSLDGKIAPAVGPNGLFGSAHDYHHLETQVAQADAVIFGAGTLRAGGTAMRVQREALIQARLAQGKPAQPIQIVCSQSGQIEPTLKFFQQPIPRYLLTTPTGAQAWQHHPGFDQIFTPITATGKLDFAAAYTQLQAQGIHRIAVLGGGVLIAALLAARLIDELWLTLCPLILGGTTAATPVAGLGFDLLSAPKCKLISQKQIGDELFLHYRILPQAPD